MNSGRMKVKKVFIGMNVPVRRTLPKSDDAIKEML
jgi:hypothetical protein